MPPWSINKALIDWLIDYSTYICMKANQFLKIFSKSSYVAGGAFEEEKVIISFLMPHLYGLWYKIL